MNDNSCCFAGHRPEKLPWGHNEESEGCILLKLKLMVQIEEMRRRGVTTFYTGMAQGVDIFAADVKASLSERGYASDRRHTPRGAGKPLERGVSGAVFQHPRCRGQRCVFAPALHAGLYARTQPLHGGTVARTLSPCLAARREARRTPWTMRGKRAWRL